MTGKIWFSFCALLMPNLLAAPPAENPFPLPDEIAKFFQTQTDTDYGVLTGEQSEKDVFRQYVRRHWRELLEHAAELPRYQGQFGNTVALIGDVGAELEPVAHLEFVKRMVELAEKGKIPRRNVFDQIAGENKKAGFMAYNYADPRVHDLVRRALALVPKDDTVTASWLRDVLSGDLAKPENMFGIRGGDDFPERLPPLKRQVAVTPSSPSKSEPSALGNPSVSSRSGASAEPRSQRSATTQGDESRVLTWRAAAVGLILLVAGISLWFWKGSRRPI